MDTKTALTVVIPGENHQSINKIRLQHDKAYPRWMPHINLIFPFVDTFDSQAMEDELKQLDDAQTLVTLNEIGFFSSGGQNTYHLKTTDKASLDNLTNLYKIASKSYQGKKKDFSPHMTLGQAKTSDHVKMMKELKDWLDQNGPIVFAISHISHLKRTDTGNFYEFKKFPLTMKVTINVIQDPNQNMDALETKDDSKQKFVNGIDPSVDTYLCIDNSGSTSGCKTYWQNVKKLLNEKYKIIIWGSDSQSISYQAAETIISKCAGSSGGTCPQTFAKQIPAKTNLIIVTDGCVENGDVKTCDDVLQGREFTSVSVYFFSTGGIINMSVSAPFVRNTEQYNIFVNGELKGTGSSNQAIDLEQYYDKPEKFLNDAENLYQLIVIQNMGRTNTTLRDSLLALSQNLMRYISMKKSNDTNANEIRNILTDLSDEKTPDATLERAVFKMRSIVNSLGESKSESVERIIQKLISKCVNTNDYSFDNLSSGRVTRSAVITNVRPDEILEESYDGEFECPVSLDDDFPLLLIKQGSPVLADLTKQELDYYLTNPLFVLYNEELVGKIKQRIDHLFGLNSVRTLFESGMVRSPFTMAQISSALSFGVDPTHIQATNYAMADIFFGRKLVGQHELWLTVLYNVIIKMPYLNNNADFIKKLQEHLIHRVKNMNTNITLSGIGSLYPFMKTSMDVAVWYCVQSPWVLSSSSISSENDGFNRLRYFGETANYLMDILDMMQYPYNKDAKKLIKLYRAFSWMMREEKNGSNWISLLKAQYQNSLILGDVKSDESEDKSNSTSNRTVILLDGPADDGKRPALPEFLNEFLDPTQKDLTLGHLISLAKLVDRTKTNTDVKIPLDLVPTEVKAVTNYDMTNKLKAPPVISISKETLRPLYIDIHKRKCWSECAVATYGSKFISLDNYFIRYVTEKLKYPTRDDFIRYISAKEANKESDRCETLPMYIERAVNNLFARYEKVLGEGFSECTVEQFIRVTTKSRDKTIRAQMDGSSQFII